MSENATTPVALDEAREQAVSILADAYGHDLIEDDEFERRVDLVHAATATGQLVELTSDLVPADAKETALARVESNALARVEDVAPSRSLVSVFGSVTRKGDWSVPMTLKVWSVFGSAEVDLREARLAPGTTNIRVNAILGGVEILVAPGTHVEMDGVGIMGGFEEHARTTTDRAAGAPVVRVQGMALLGRVEVFERLPGESKWQARKRRRRERKALRAGRG